MKKVKMLKSPIEFYNWLNARKINLQKETGRKLTYADVMRIIGKTKYISIDDQLLNDFFSKKRCKNVFI